MLTSFVINVESKIRSISLPPSANQFISRSTPPKLPPVHLLNQFSFQMNRRQELHYRVQSLFPVVLDVLLHYCTDLSFCALLLELLLLLMFLLDASVDLSERLPREGTENGAIFFRLRTQSGNELVGRPTGAHRRTGNGLARTPFTNRLRETRSHGSTQLVFSIYQQIIIVVILRPFKVGLWAITLAMSEYTPTAGQKQSSGATQKRD